MSDQTPPSAPDDQPTQQFAATAGHQPAPYPTPSVGPTTTAYPAGQAATAGSVPPRRGLPAWAIAAAVVGAVVLVGGGFAGGLGAGLLLSHRDSAVVERADLRGQMMDRLDERRSGNDRPSWGDGSGRLGGGHAGQDRILPPDPGTSGQQDDGDQDAPTESGTTAP